MAKTIKHKAPQYRDTSKTATNALLASARRLTSDVKDQRGQLVSRNTGDSWQAEAWEYYDLVGELRFLVNTLAGQLSRANLYVGYQADFNADPERVENPEITSILEALGDNRGRTSQIMRRLAVNLYIAGEGWIVGVPRADPETGLRGSLDDLGFDALEWHILSVAEVNLKQDGLVKLHLDQDDQPELNLNDIFLIRIWQEHPQKSWEADSSVRSSLPILNELVKLTMHVSAQADSRLAGAGILVVPQSAQDALKNNGYGEEYSYDGEQVLYENPSEDYFTEALIEAMGTAIQDRASASAIVPVVATVPDDSVGKVQHLSFASSLDAEARNLRDEALRRLALSMDAPPEVLLGTSSMNHWGGWLVKEETVSTHLETPLSLICDALTTEYLWAILRGMGLPESEVTRYSVRYDVDHLITRPSMSGDAKDLYASGAISEEALRRSVGFDEADAPDQNLDLVRKTVLGMVKNSPNLLVNPGLDALIEQMTKLIEGDTSETVQNNPLAGEGEGEDDDQPITPAQGDGDGDDAEDSSPINGNIEEPVNDSQSGEKSAGGDSSNYPYPNPAGEPTAIEERGYSR